MTRSLWFVITFSILISACAPATQTVPVPLVEQATGTPSSIPTSTQTSIPSPTPTASITPLPTIPTFTPTFDVSTIVTVTPAQKAECPKIDAAVAPEIYFPNKLEYPSANSDQQILKYLNQGGDAEALVRRLDQIYSINEFRGGYAFHDLTGNQNNEFLYVDLYYNGKPIVFSCKNGEYSVLAILSGKYDHDFYKTKIEELIPDGLPEIIVEGTSGVSFPVPTFYIYKWDGNVFSLLGQITFAATRQTEINDVDGNGTKEIILTGGNPICISCSNFIPQRQRTLIYGWNGKQFVELSNEFEAPEYRFQAIQDADTFVLVGRLDDALGFYEKIISNNDLEWWSPERFVYEQDAPYRWLPEYTPVPEPIVDTTEYPRLAAYAYYRIMLIHLVQGNESDAGTVYNTLQQKFGNDPYGHPYVEMASAFWDTY